MKKFVALLLAFGLVCSMGITLVGCGDGGNKKTSTTTGTEGKKTTTP